MSWRDEGDEALPPPRSSEPTNLRADILDELADHLTLATEREGEREQGEPSNETQWARVLKQFGDPNAIARRLWWDAMRETVMREWIQTSAIVAGAAAVLLFVALGFRQMQATNLAVLAALERQSGDAAEVFSTLDLTIHRGTADGPPADNIKVSMRGKWFGEDYITVEEKPDADGHISLGPIRQGQYTLSFLDPNSGLKLERSLTLFGGRKEVLIVAPFAETTKVDLDLGLPEFSDDNHQLVRSTLEFEWSEGDNIWASSVDVVIGRNRMWELEHPNRGRVGGRVATRVQRSPIPPSNADRLGRARQVDTRGSRGSPRRLTHYDRDELLDLRLPHRTRLQVVSLNGAIATPKGQTKEFQEWILQDSNEFLAELTAPLEMEAQEFTIADDNNQQIAVALPQPFLDAFTREARIQRNTATMPNLHMGLAQKLGLDFDREVSMEAIKAPLFGVVCTVGDNAWQSVSPASGGEVTIGTMARPSRRPVPPHVQSDSTEIKLRFGAYIPIPKMPDLTDRSSSTRVILTVLASRKIITLQAFAVRTALNLGGVMEASSEAPPDLSMVKMDAEPIWRRPDEETGWLRIDITEQLRAAGPENPFHGVFLFDPENLGDIYGTRSEELEDADDNYPRLLIIDN